MYSYADGLITSGWQVEITTASPQAPTDLSNYSMLLLSCPIYDLNPGPTITHCVDMVGNLNGIKTVVIAIGGGIDPPLHAPNIINKIVQNAN